MGRLILLTLAVLAAVWLIRRALRGSSGPSNSSDGNGELVQCARCGLHLPKIDAYKLGDRYYCSGEHAREGIGGA